MTKSDKETESISKSLIRGGLMRTIAFLANVIATLIVMPLLIEGLGARNYGMWATIGSIVAYYGLLDLGLASTNERFMAQSLASQDSKQANSIFTTSVITFGGIGFFFLIVTFIIASLAAIFFSNPEEAHLFRFSILILGANFALTFPFYAVEGALSANLLFESIAIARVVSVVVRTGLVIFLMANEYSLIALALAIACTSLVYRSLLVHALATKMPSTRLSPEAFSLDTLKSLYHHGKYVFLGSVSSNAHFRLSNIIVGSVLGLSAVTLYAVASRLSEYLNSLIQRLFSVLHPVLSSANATLSKSEFDFVFWQAFQVNVTVTASLFGLALVLAKSFILLWLGPGFEDSYTLFSILAGGLALKQMQTSSLQALMARSRHQKNNILEMVESLSSIGLALLLGNQYGLIGIAIGIITPMTINKAGLQPIIRCRDLEISLGRYYLTIVKGAAPIILVSGVAWIALQSIIISNWVVFLGAAALITVFYVPVVFLTLPTPLRHTLITNFTPRRLR